MSESRTQPPPTPDFPTLSPVQRQDSLFFTAEVDPVVYPEREPDEALPAIRTLYEMARIPMQPYETDLFERLTDNPQSAWRWNALGLHLAKNEFTEQAIEAFKQAYALTGGAAYVVRLAELYKKLGRDAESQHCTTGLILSSANQSEVVSRIESDRIFPRPRKVEPETSNRHSLGEYISEHFASVVDRFPDEEDKLMELADNARQIINRFLSTCSRPDHPDKNERAALCETLNRDPMMESLSPGARVAVIRFRSTINRLMDTGFVRPGPVQFSDFSTPPLFTSAPPPFLPEKPADLTEDAKALQRAGHNAEALELFHRAVTVALDRNKWLRAVAQVFEEFTALIRSITVKHDLSRTHEDNVEKIKHLQTKFDGLLKKIYETVHNLKPELPSLQNPNLESMLPTLDSMIGFLRAEWQTMEFMPYNLPERVSDFLVSQEENRDDPLEELHADIDAWGGEGKKEKSIYRRAKNAGFHQDDLDPVAWELREEADQEFNRFIELSHEKLFCYFNLGQNQEAMTLCNSIVHGAIRNDAHLRRRITSLGLELNMVERSENPERPELARRKLKIENQIRQLHEDLSRLEYLMVEFYCDRALTHLRLNKPDKHEKCLADVQAGLALDPENGRLHQLRDLCALETELAWSQVAEHSDRLEGTRRQIQLQADIACLRKEFAHPDYFLVAFLVDRAQKKHAEGNHEAALTDVETGLARDPENRRLNYLKGLCLHGMGMVQKGLVLAAQELERDPENHALHHVKGLCLFATGNYEQGLAEYKMALRDPRIKDKWWIQSDIGAAEEKSGLRVHSSGSYLYAICLDPREERPANQISDLIVSFKKNPDALNEIFELCAVTFKKESIFRGKDPALRAAVARRLYGAFLQAALSAGDADQAGLLERAMGFLRSVQEVLPDFKIEFKEEPGSLAEKAGYEPGTLPYAMVDRVGNSEEWFVSGLTAFGQKRYREAVERLETALAIKQQKPHQSPAFADVCLNLGLAHEAMGSSQRAEVTYLTLLALDPSNALAKVNLQRIRSVSGKNR